MVRQRHIAFGANIEGAPNPFRLQNIGTAAHSHSAVPSV
jgi:hypothetical protein